MICWSLYPMACIWAMRSLAGLEDGHSSMLQVATVSLQPHWQARWAPTRRTSTLGFSEAAWASAATTRAESKYVFTAQTRSQRRKRGEAIIPGFSPRFLCAGLALNRNMFLRNPHHFSAGVLQLDFAGDEADQRSADQREAADPDP